MHLATGEVPFVLAMAAGAEDFLVAHSDASAASTAALHHIVLGSEPTSATLVLGGTLGDLAAVGVAGGWLLASEERAAGETRVRARPIASPLVEGTVSAGEPSDIAEVPARSLSLTTFDGRIIAAYGAADGVNVRSLDAAGRPLDEALLVGPAAGAVEVTASGTGSYVAWSDADGRVFGRRVQVGARTLGTIRPLNASDPSPTGVFAIGFDGTTYAALSGAEDLDVRTARFRRISAEGDVAPQPRLLPYTGGEHAAFSVARFAAGFAVAYRQAQLGRNQLRLALVDSHGSLVSDTLLLGLMRGEGQVLLRQANDGTLAVTWDDRTDGAEVLRAAGVTCVR